MNKRIFIFMAILILPTLIFASAEKKDFQFYKNITGVQNVGVNYIDIDSDIESKSKKFLSDIRIFSDNEEVPFKIIKEKDVYEKKIENSNLEILSKNNNTYILNLANEKKENYLNNIFIKTQEKDFRRVVNIYGADLKEGPYFNLNVEKKRGDLIYHLPQGSDNKIDFKYSNYKFLKLIFSGDEGGFSENGFYKTNIKTNIVSGEKDFLNVAGRESDLEGNNQKIIFDVKKENLFFDQVQINFIDKRFSRNYILYGSDSAEAEILESGKRFDDKKDYWVKISSGNFEKETYIGNPVLNLNNDKRFYRLDILNGDNKKLMLESTVFEKFKKRIYFDSMGKNAKIFYGGDRVKKANYDLIFSENQIKNSKKVNLGGEKENVDFVEEKTSIFDDNKWLIYLSIGIIMFVLGFFVYKIIREAGGKTDRDGMQI